MQQRISAGRNFRCIQRCLYISIRPRRLLLHIVCVRGCELQLEQTVCRRVQCKRLAERRMRRNRDGLCLTIPLTLICGSLIGEIHEEAVHRCRAVSDTARCCRKAPVGIHVQQLDFCKIVCFFAVSDTGAPFKRCFARAAVTVARQHGHIERAVRLCSKNRLPRERNFIARMSGFLVADGLELHALHLKRGVSVIPPPDLRLAIIVGEAVFRAIVIAVFAERDLQTVAAIHTVAVVCVQHVVHHIHSHIEI